MAEETYIEVVRKAVGVRDEEVVGTTQPVPQRDFDRVFELFNSILNHDEFFIRVAKRKAKQQPTGAEVEGK
ncbi:MAG TPA: hypothetical protein VEF04_04710 [Blastocatellia bacterium]|nr:hypothetical protein [Blastocatellia bacterium]